MTLLDLVPTNGMSISSEVKKTYCVLNSLCNWPSAPVDLDLSKGCKIGQVKSTDVLELFLFCTSSDIVCSDVKNFQRVFVVAREKFCYAKLNFGINWKGCIIV